MQDAKEGAAYARQQYDKYSTAFNDATKAADTLRHQAGARPGVGGGGVCAVAGWEGARL